MPPEFTCIQNLTNLARHLHMILCKKKEPVPKQGWNMCIEMTKWMTFPVIWLLMGLMSPSQAGHIEGRVDGPPGSSAIIAIRGIAGEITPRRTPYAISQKYMRFSPKILPILIGETVNFPNDDIVIYHNVFSHAVINKFDLGTYRVGVTRSFTFQTPEIVEILCRIHSRMYAVVVVLDNPFYATVESDGSYAIQDVPPGVYTIELIVSWKQEVKTYRKSVTISASGHLRLDWNPAASPISEEP